MSGQKICPKCGGVQPIDQVICTGCQHQFRTKFAPVVNQTVALPSFPANQPVGQMPSKLPSWANRQGPDPRFPAYQDHSPWAAGILAFLFTGAGQLYNKQFAKAAILILGMFTVIGPLAFFLGMLMWFLVFLPWLVFQACLIADAVFVACRVRRGERVYTWDWF